MSSEGMIQMTPDQLSHICQEVAHGISKILLEDVQQVVDDIRRQYRDHNELLARQELTLQRLQSCENSMPLSAKKPQQTKPVFACCQHDPEIGDDVRYSPSIGENGVYVSPRRLAESVAKYSPRTKCSPRTAQGVVRVPPKHGQEARQSKERLSRMWVVKKLAEQVARFAPMSPRLCPPAPPHPGLGSAESEISDPGSIEETSNSNISDDRNSTGHIRSLKLNLMDIPAAPSIGDEGEHPEKQIEFSKKHVGLPKVASDGHERETQKNHPHRRHSHSQSQNNEHKLFGEMGMDKSTLDQEEYNVANFYHERGIAQLIARSDLFANVTLMVIFLNACYIGYDADKNHKDNLLDADLQFQICENLFCVFFFLEWLVRFLAFKYKSDCMKDMWFKFDTVLVVMMVVETWILPVALSGGTGIPSGLVKLVRLLRLARMARIMRAFPDLVAMIKGVKVASRAVSSALLMLLGLLYVFAIIMFTLLKDDRDEKIDSRFRRLGLTMWTLLIDGTFLDGIGFVSRSLLDTDNYFPLVVLLIFVLLSALTVMNMLIGVLCEVVASVAAAEKEDSAIRLVKDKLLNLLRELDEDGSGEISREEIVHVLGDDAAMLVLENLQVDVNHLLEHLDMFFEEGGDLTIYQIMDLILMLRGDRPPTMKDMLHGQTFSRWKTSQALDELRKRLIAVERCTMFQRETISEGKVGEGRFWQSMNEPYDVNDASFAVDAFEEGQRSAFTAPSRRRSHNSTELSRNLDSTYSRKLDSIYSDQKPRRAIHRTMTTNAV